MLSPPIYLISALVENKVFCRQSRSSYTVGEDLAIIESVLRHSKHHSINGTRLWELLVAHKVQQQFNYVYFY